MLTSIQNPKINLARELLGMWQYLNGHKG